MPYNLYFLAVWTKFNTFNFQIHYSKMSKSVDRSKTFISVNNKLPDSFIFMFRTTVSKWFRFTPVPEVYSITSSKHKEVVCRMEC